MSRPLRYVIISDSSLTTFSSRFLQLVLNDKTSSCAGVIINTKPRPSRWEQIAAEFKKKRGGYVLIMIIKGILSRLNKGRKATAAVDFFKKWNLFPPRQTPSLYDDETIRFIRDLSPDFIIRAGFGIIKEPVLSLTPIGVLSYHHGNIRKFRGQPPAFWELYEGSEEMSATVQILNSGIDTGQIVEECQIKIKKSESWAKLTDRIYQESEILMLNAIKRISNHDFKPICLDTSEIGPLYTTPNLRQWLTLQVKVGCRRLGQLFVNKTPP